MKLPFHTTTLVGIGVSAAMRLAADADLEPASWCFTYLSDILVPVSAFPDTPAGTIPPTSDPSPLTEDSEAQTVTSRPSTESPLQSEIYSLTETALNLTSSDRADSLLSSTITTPGPVTSPTLTSSPTPSVPTLREIILFIYPSAGQKRHLETRANAGFLNNDVAERQESCNDATVFTLASGQLSDGGSPIYYFPGENYKQLRSAGSLPDGAISTNFTIDKGILEFSNTSLPGGEASFCEDGTTGGVYMTFTSSPPNCEAVYLTSYGVEQCQNGEIVGAQLPSARSTRASTRGVSSDVSTEDASSPALSSQVLPTTNTTFTSITNSISSMDPVFSTVVSTTDSISEETKQSESWIIPASTTPSSQSSSSESSASGLKPTEAMPSSERTESSSSTSHPGIEISFSLSPTESEPQTTSPQTPSPQTPSPQRPSPQTPIPQTPSLQTPSPQMSNPEISSLQTPSDLSSFTDKEESGSTDTSAETTGPSNTFSGEESLPEPSAAEQTPNVPIQTPTTVCEEGLEYAVYFFGPGSPECAELEKTTQAGDPLDLDLTKVIEGRVPRTVGKLPGLDLSGVSVGDQCVAIELRGSIVVDETGQYNLEILGTVRELAYVWHGDAALSGRFEPSNSALRKFHDSQQNALVSASFTESASTRYRPIRIFMGSPILSIWFQISIDSPSGIDSSFATCPEGENAPAWEPWEQERVGTRSPDAPSEPSTGEENSSPTSSSSPTSTPTPECEAGVEYAVYFFPEGSDECQALIETSSTQDPLNLKLARIIDGKAPQATGITPNIYGLELDPQPGEPTTIYDYMTPSDVDVSSSCTVVCHRGYLVLPNPDSSYPLFMYVDVDDMIYVWGGDAALSEGFGPRNTIIRRLMGTWNNDQTYYNFGVEYTTLLQRDVIRYIPIRVFYANLPGAGQFHLAMNGAPPPEFNTCSGDQISPNWLPWDQERSFTSTPVCTPGLEYAIYTYSTTTPEYWELEWILGWGAIMHLDMRQLLQDKAPQGTGNTESVEWSSDDETSPIAIYGFSADSGTSLSNAGLVVQHRGFVKFHGPGTYTFEIAGDLDTVLFVWLGEASFSGRYYTRISYLAQYYQSSYTEWVTFPYTVSDADEYLPIRIFYANLIGPGAFKVSISGPAGTPPPSLVQCSGVEGVPDWLPWDQEQHPYRQNFGRAGT